MCNNCKALEEAIDLLAEKYHKQVLLNKLFKEIITKRPFDGKVFMSEACLNEIVRSSDDAY
jgi:hypothetical protein